jgi:eukaryotic-like serine/threonine-protein kinase
MSPLIHDAGQLIGNRYVVVKYVGEGGMQQVYEANDTLLARVVALKVSKNPSAEKRFQRSAAVSARINHANVAKTLDYFEEKERGYLIEEYVSGKDLGRVLKEDFQILDPLMAAKIFHHLARGLAASHHATVIHRDLKPSNIMVVDGGSLTDVKITDFGIAKMAEEELAAVEGGESSLTASYTAIGALPYMAPEMIKSIKKAGTSADVWSLGALMFELISGEKPFGVGYKAVPAIMEAKVPPLPAMVRANAQFKYTGEEIYGLIKACLSADPTARPTADELVLKCGMMCYPDSAREFGRVRTFNNNYWGFIAADSGDDVFFHIDSVFGEEKIKIGDRVWFARHVGGGADRAFPIMKAIQVTNQSALF